MRRLLARPMSRWPIALAVAIALAGSLLVATPMVFVWRAMERLGHELPPLPIFWARDLRFALTEVTAIDGLLSDAQQAPMDPTILPLVTRASERLQEYIAQLPSAPPRLIGVPFDALARLSGDLEGEVARLVDLERPLQPGDLQRLRTLSGQLAAGLDVAVRAVEADPGYASGAKGLAIRSLKIEVVGTVAVLTALVVLIVALLLKNWHAAARIRETSRRDPLTGLVNRVGFQDWLSRRGANESPVAIAILDLDHFKAVNDQHGHEIGDRILVETAAWLARAVGGSGLVVRWGGDEFVVAMPLTWTETLAAVWLGELLENAPTFQVESAVYPVAFSGGMAILPANGSSVTDVLTRADIALFEAKEGARGRVLVYHPVMADRRSHERWILESIERALVNGGLSLAWQPQLALPDGRVVGAEALLRFTDPATGITVPPGEFIPIAERSDLILSIDRFVIEEACRVGGRWNAGGAEPLRIAVNVSPRQFRTGRLVEIVATALATNRLPAELLEIEITEGVLLGTSDTVTETLKGLADLGVRLALDDFGTGFSNVAYLVRLKPELLKLDRSFLREGDPDVRRDILVSLVHLADAIGAEALIEGVESVDDAELATAIGCDIAQGYHFAPPMDVGIFEAWRERHPVHFRRQTEWSATAPMLWTAPLGVGRAAGRFSGG